MEQRKKSTVENTEIQKLPVFEKYAIIKTGGKQYQALEGKTIAIEKIDGDAGTKIEFNEVLLRKLSEGNVEFGKPFLAGAVKASIVKQMRGPKLISFRFKRRKKVRVKRGHRQPVTVIRIETI
jgi:large subunit ribosomal protein L21